MTVETKCDGEHQTWQNEIPAGEKVYCEECYTTLKDRVDELEIELEEEKESVENYEEQNEELSDEIGELKAKVEELKQRGKKDD